MNETKKRELLSFLVDLIEKIANDECVDWHVDWEFLHYTRRNYTINVTTVERQQKTGATHPRRPYSWKGKPC